MRFLRRLEQMRLRIIAAEMMLKGYDRKGLDTSQQVSRAIDILRGSLDTLIDDLQPDCVKEASEASKKQFEWELGE